jgi:hypothetical protein
MNFRYFYAQFNTKEWNTIHFESYYISWIFQTEINLICILTIMYGHQNMTTQHEPSATLYPVTLIQVNLYALYPLFNLFDMAVDIYCYYVG